MERVEHERQLSYELAQLNLHLQMSTDDTPLTDLIGSAPGSFATLKNLTSSSARNETYGTTRGFMGRSPFT